MNAKIVKSAGRIFEILELFDQKKRPMPAVDIASSLGYPLASTHELLKTMTALGYFTFGEPKWAYMPSQKLPMVVDWVRDAVSENRRIGQFMSDLNAITKETINLSRQLPHVVKIIKGLECLYEIGVSSKPGTEMTTTKSLTGMVSLAALSNTQLETYLSVLEKEDPVQYSDINFNLLKEVRVDVIASGTAMRCNLAVQGIGALCLPIKLPDSNQVFIIGIVGPSERIQKNSFSHQQAIMKLVKEHQISTLYKIRAFKT